MKFSLCPKKKKKKPPEYKATISAVVKQMFNVRKTNNPTERGQQILVILAKKPTQNLFL